eukprot:snap_masked-scaffold_23-processed-gene-2.17-mRNA-1 protein AED:1.00 eAED:1.00 QI:0/-1/0/0/-1/1/1/0/72
MDLALNSKYVKSTKQIKFSDKTVNKIQKKCDRAMLKPEKQFKTDMQIFSTVYYPNYRESAVGKEPLIILEIN